MTTSDDVTAEFNDESARNNTGWRRRLKLFLASCAVCIIVIAAVQVYANLTHKPQLIYPPGYEAALKAMPKVDPQLVDRYYKAYGLDNYECVVGKKYSALCQDGEISFDGPADACKDQGGVKAWVECR